MLLIGVLIVDKVVENCDHLTFFLWEVACFGFAAVTIGRGIYKVYANRDDKGRCGRLLYGLFETFTMGLFGLLQLLYQAPSITVS